MDGPTQHPHADRALGRAHRRKLPLPGGVGEGVDVGFYGSFHEVRPNQRIVQTFTYEDVPDGVSLETMTFEELPDGRTRTVGLSVVDSFEARDAMLSSGMEVGVVEGYEKLDELLGQER
jgi:uncharacterized protein YndB with AHSA1/START domain